MNGIRCSVNAVRRFAVRLEFVLYGNSSCTVIRLITVQDELPYRTNYRTGRITVQDELPYRTNYRTG